MSLLISFFTGIRLTHVGKDTEAYANHFFNSSVVDGVYGRLEIGFALLMQTFSKNSFSVEVFFACVAFIITFVYLHIFTKIHSKCFFDSRASTNILLVFFSLVLFSSWYLVATTNGLRQGLSVVFLYWCGVELFYYQRKLKFLFLYAISISFHYSAIMIMPFLLLNYLRFRYVFLLWLLAAFGYMLGINELIVKGISQAFNLPVYEFVKYYSVEEGAVGSGLYEGFIFSFFLYTLFWPLFLLSLLMIKIRLKCKVGNLENIYQLIKMYFLFSLVYFIMGFGPFSNRYAFFAWFLVPYMQIVILNLTFNLNFDRAVPLLLLFLSVFCFLFFKLDWIPYALT